MICDLSSTIYDEGRATTTRGEQAMVTMSEYWGFFGLVLVQRLCIGFFFFFLINTVLVLVCFAFALYRLY